jgi:tryptophan-rich sensory protein
MGAETSSSSADPAYFRWWHAVLIFLLANGLSALPAVVLGATAFTNSFSEPAVAPPDWLFAPLWFFLNVTSLIALSVIANAPQRTIQRRIFLASEAVGWGLYSIFTTVYFLLRSPSLGAIDTLAGLVVGVRQPGLRCPDRCQGGNVDPAAGAVAAAGFLCGNPGRPPQHRSVPGWLRRLMADG